MARAIMAEVERTGPQPLEPGHLPTSAGTRVYTDQDIDLTTEHFPLLPGKSVLTNVTTGKRYDVDHVSLPRIESFGVGDEMRLEMTISTGLRIIHLRVEGIYK